MNEKQTWDIGRLNNWEKNPRTVSKSGLERLKRQIEKLGQYKPLLVTSDGTVLGGNMRLKAYRELGISEVWVSVVEAETEEKMLEYALSDNDRIGEYDKEAVIKLIDASPELDLSLYSIDLGKVTPLDLLNPAEPEEDEVPEVDDSEDADSVYGTIYRLGNHRLMCGDSTQPNECQLLMDGTLADMVFTDPPYNVDYTGKTKDALKIGNDSMSDGDFYSFLFLAYSRMAESSKKGASIYVCHADSEGLNFRKAMKDAGWLLKQCIVWAKQSMVLGRQDYQWQHEPILYGWKEGASHYFTSDRTQTTLWNIDRPSRSSDHPTMKPIELVSKAIRNSSKSDDVVLDLFGGSGSTLVACEQLGRTCYMMELDPKYCDVIRKRYANLTSPENWESEWKSLTPSL